MFTLVRSFASSSVSVMSWHKFPIFVYGTLKRGQPNHYIIKSAIDKGEAVFIGPAVTTDLWPMIVYKPYNTPYLLDCKGTGKKIFGELFRVNDETLRELDELEDHPTVYTRDKINVLTLGFGLNHAAEDMGLKNGVQLICEAYFMRNFKRDLLATEPLLSNYTDNTDCKFVLHYGAAAIRV